MYAFDRVCGFFGYFRLRIRGFASTWAFGQEIEGAQTTYAAESAEVSKQPGALVDAALSTGIFVFPATLSTDQLKQLQAPTKR